MLIFSSAILSLLTTPTNNPAKYNANRAVNIVKELAERSVGVLPTSSGSNGNNAELKSEILSQLAPFGDPALNVPTTAFDDVNELCRKLEKRNPSSSQKAAIEALQGTWKVRFSDAPPPSNGALGPFRGRAFQVVDVASKTYTNELAAFGGALFVKLLATFEPKLDSPSSAVALRVAFRTITFSLFGVALPAVTFPAGTERTWLLTYADDDTRLVRAGVDGGKSTVRDLGLIDKAEGEAADAYLFVLTRATQADLSPARQSNPLATAAKRRELKASLLAACRDSRLGAGADAARVTEIEKLMMALAALNPTPDPASSPALCGTWDIFWTTESELLALTDNGFFGLPCTGSFQTISRAKDEGSGSGWAYTLGNNLEFADGSSTSGGSSGAGAAATDASTGFLRVGSTCEPAQSGGRVDFRFESCAAKWKRFEVPLPPVGAGWFDCIYLDEDLRLCKDSRGDLQICTRRK